MSTLLLILSLFYFKYISYCSGAACANLQTQGACQLSPSCEWNNQTAQKCYCSSNAPLDVVFIIDESGSVGSTNYVLEKNFVANMIRQGLSAESNVHVATFGYDVRTGYRFWDNQDNKEYIAQQVENIDYERGWTRMDLAVRYVYEDVFPYWQNHANYKGYKTLLVFLTDGNPCCTSDANICVKGQWPNQRYVPSLHAVVPDVIVVGIGNNWSPSTVQCLVTPNWPTNLVANTDRIIKVEKWTASSFADAAILTEAFLCPDQFSLKVTEIRMEEYSNQATTHQSRFVEFWNDGDDLDLTKGNLKFEGLLNSGSSGFGVGGLSTCNRIISAGQYVVIYDPSLDPPTCPQCNCTLSGSVGNERCSEAMYIACNSTAATSGCGACSWNTNMDNDDWYEIVSDFANDEVLSFGNRTQSDSSWVNVYQGYSTELVNVLLDPSKGTSWQKSCDYPGTPGAAPLSPCTITCIREICQSQGDVNASCNTGFDQCVCTDSLKYYSSPSLYCLKLYPPVWCRVVNEWDPDRQEVLARVDWSIVGVNYEGLVYFKVTDPRETSISYGLNAYKGYSIRGDATVYMTAAYQDAVNGEIISDRVDCDILTEDPTKEPTQSPTFSNADIDDCTATIIGYNRVEISWSDGYKGEPNTDIDGPYTYFIYGWWDKGDKEHTEFSSYTTVPYETFYLQPSQTLDFTNGEPEIYVVTQIMDQVTGGIDFDRMKADGEGKRLCNIKTSAPTKSPTLNPSQTPTKNPTNVPSTNPTQTPTYNPWSIEGCTVTIPAAHEIDAKGVSVRFYYTKPPITSDKYIISFIVDDIERATSGSEYATASLSHSEAVTAIINNGFEAQIEYEEYPGKTTKTGRITCDYTTISPTRSPTTDPTKAPTTDPTKDPTKTPSKAPSKTPTKSPTYQKLPLPSPCTVTVNSGLTYLSIKFIETRFDDEDPNTPPLNDIFYLITIGPTLSDEMLEYKIAARTSETNREHIIPSFEENEFVVNNDKTKVKIYIVDGTEDNNDIGDDTTPIQCDLLTLGPTASPITPAPTKNPVTEQPVVRLDLVERDSEGNIIKIKDWGFDAEADQNCIFPTETRRRLQDDGGNGTTTTSSPVIIVPNCDDCPVCFVKENLDQKYLRIIRTPIDFLFDLIVGIKITYLVDSSDAGISKKDFDFRSINKKWKKLFESKTIEESYILGASDGELVIPYKLNTADEDEEEAEAFEFSIISCSVDESDGAINAVKPDGLKGVYSCGVDQDNDAVIISIEKAKEGDKFTTTTMGSMPMWVWFPIGFAAIAIPILAYLIWRFYQGKKRADVMEMQRKHELGEAEKQDDVGEFGIIGDNITSNPIATGAAFEVPKGDEIINHQLTLEKMNFEPAQVDVEHNIFKQDFGPVQVEKHFGDIDDENNNNI